LLLPLLAATGASEQPQWMQTTDPGDTATAQLGQYAWPWPTGTPQRIQTTAPGLTSFAQFLQNIT